MDGAPAFPGGGDAEAPEIARPIEMLTVASRADVNRHAHKFNIPAGVKGTCASKTHMPVIVISTRTGAC